MTNREAQCEYSSAFEHRGNRERLVSEYLRGTFKNSRRTDGSVPFSSRERNAPTVANGTACVRVSPSLLG